MRYDLYLRMNLDCVSKERTWVMGVSMLMIMLRHQHFLDSSFFGFFHALGDRGVDIFFFLSGMGIYHSLSHNNLPRYFSNRFWRIMPVVIIAGLFKFAFDGFCGSLFSCTFREIWFIYGIAFCYLLAPFLYRVLNRSKRIFFYSTILFCIVQLLLSKEFLGAARSMPFLHSLLFILSRLTLPRFPAFVLGMILASRACTGMGKSRPVLTLVLLSVCFIMKGGYLPTADAFPLDIQLYAVAFFFLPCLPTLTQWVAVLGDKCRKFAAAHTGVVFFGTCSLEIYLIHEQLFKKLFWLCEMTGGFVCLLLAMLASCAIAWCIKLLYQALRKSAGCCFDCFRGLPR